MEVLFENKYTRRKDVAGVFFRRYTLRHPLMIFVYVACAMYLVAGISTSISEQRIAWEFLYVPAGFLAIVVLIYYGQVTLTMKRARELHDEVVENIVTVSDENVTITQSNGSINYIHCENIKRALCTKKYIFLLTKARIAIPLCKDAFTIGTTEEFLCFLKKKGVKVK